MDENKEILTFKDEDGNDIELELLGKIGYEGRNFAFLTFTENEPDEEEPLLIFETSGSDGSETYDFVEDEKLGDILFGLFREKYKDEFGF